MKKFLVNILKPNSTNEDLRRKEYIFNLLALGSIILCTVALISVSYYYLNGYRANSPFLILGLTGFFCFLLFLSKKGLFILASYIFIFLYVIPSLLTMAQWGIDVPQSLLIFALSIIMGGILISTRFALSLSLVESLLLFLLQTLQSNGTIPVVRTWRNQTANTGDTIIFIATLIIITVISWLSNREIEKSLIRARKSEAELKKERDSLELKVEERTTELKKAQLEQLTSMNHFAELGKLSSGVVHDLVNPLTAVSLCLKELKSSKTSDNIQGAEFYIKEALQATKKMEAFLTTVRKQMSTAEIKNKFSLLQEVKESVSLLNFKSHEKRVKFTFDINKDITVYGNSLKFSQIITNLVNNSIDAFANNPGKDNVIDIVASSDGKNIDFKIKDNGPGIPSKFIDKVFDPFFTSKDYSRGTGIGLTIVKDVVENHFNGKVSLSSDEDGTTVNLLIPAFNANNK